MKIYDRIMGLGTKMTDMDASTYQGAFIGKISYTVDRAKAEAADSITYEYCDVKENAFMYILSILGKVEGEETPVEKMTITLVKASDRRRRSREWRRRIMRTRSHFTHLQRKRFMHSARRQETRIRSTSQTIL